MNKHCEQYGHWCSHCQNTFRAEPNEEDRIRETLHLRATVALLRAALEPFARPTTGPDDVQWAWINDAKKVYEQTGETE